MSIIIRNSGLIKWITFIIGMATIAFVLFFVFEAERRFDKVSHDLSHRLLTVSETVETLSALSAETGYGGFIHNFKNFVLRRDESYKLAAIKNEEHIRSYIKKLKVLIKDENSISSLDTIERTIAEYRRNLLLLKRELSSGQVVADDRIVKVNDTMAIKAFRDIYASISNTSNQTIQEASINQKKAREFVEYGFFLIVLIMGATLFLIVLIRKLEVKNLQADVANEEKDKLLSTMRHEIRTPLNGVLSLVQLLNLKRFSPEEKYHLDLIQSSGELLLGILNDVLEMSKIEANEVELESVPVHVNRLLESLTDFYKNIASEKGLLVEYKSSIEEFSYLDCDPTKIRQVLGNIISNSIKFLEAGRILVEVNGSVEQIDSEQKICALQITVSDTGIGMSDVEMTTMFDQFSQADSSISRRFGGTGLGMGISKQLCELMGGHIDVRSARDEGSVFVIHLSLPVSTKEEVVERYVGDADYASIFNGRKALVAEDNLVNAVVAKGFLENMGLRVRIAHDGNEVLKLFDEEQPDFILMDINMPHKDGIETARVIRSRPNGAHIPIWALTADAFSDTNIKCIEAGMNGVITKPFTFNMLRNKLYDTLK